jgi:hypothetical protein
MSTQSVPNPHAPVTIEAYQPDVYNQLNVFSTSKALLPRYKKYLACLGHVIVRHKLHDRLGISLLHKHFDLNNDEILLRHIDKGHNCAYMEPAKQASAATPYLWKPVRGPEGQWSFFPLEYLQTQDKASTPGSYLTGLSPFLVEIADTLESLQVLDLFSIAEANITSIRLQPDEILVETTDSKKRRLDLKPVPDADVNIDEVTETFWMFSPIDGPAQEPGEGPTETPTEGPTEAPAEGATERKPAGVCTGQHCLGHCKSHCKGHCKSHCLDHKFTV